MAERGIVGVMQPEGRLNRCAAIVVRYGDPRMCNGYYERDLRITIYHGDKPRYFIGPFVTTTLWLQTRTFMENRYDVEKAAVTHYRVK